MSTALAQDIPKVFSKALDISVDSIIVVSITKSSSNSTSNRLQQRSENIAVIVTMAVPHEVVKPLQTLIATLDSNLYTMNLGQLPKLIDPTYPVESRSGKPQVIDTSFLQNINYFDNSNQRTGHTKYSGGP
jgi:hypothetical protein